MKKMLNVGVIGFGMIGKVHACAYKVLPFYCDPFSFVPRVTHVATSRAETARKAQELLGCPFATADFREITENPDVDIVDICSPNNLHTEALLSAIKNNKHIYCDKPLCVTAEEAELVSAAFLATDGDGNRLYSKTSQMTFHLRFYSAIRRAKQLLDEGRIGRILQYRAAYYHASNAKSATPFKWKQGPSGGVVLDLAAHVVDLVDFLIGLPDEMIAQTHTAFGERRDAADANKRHTELAEDAVSILTRTRTPEGGYTGVIEATKLATGYEDDVCLEIHGERGAIRFSLMSPHELGFFDALEPDRPFGGTSGWKKIAVGSRYETPETDFPSAKSTPGWFRGHIASLVNFLGAVEAGESGNPNLLQGVRIQKALDAVTRSARTGAWIPLTDLK